MSKHKNTRKIMISLGVVGAAAAVAGMGTFGTFTSTTSGSQGVSSGTVKIALGADGTVNNRLSVGASNIVPGDTIQRTATLTNGASTSPLSAITLTTTATTTTGTAASSLLDTDALNGLQMTIQSCGSAWTETGTAPGYTYSCTATGGPSTVVGPRPVIGKDLGLAGLTAVTPNLTDNLMVTLALPTGADNTFQGKSSVINFAFTGTQRGATNK